MNLNYVASPTIAKFAACTSEVQLLLGPLGGGKTTGVLMKHLAMSCHQKPTRGGIRKTRWAVVRNTRQQLRDSVLKTVFDWLPPDGKHVIWRETDMTMLLKFQLPDDTYVQSEFLFRPLDDEDDARRLLSVEYTGGWLSEFREIPIHLLKDLESRTGRYPSIGVDGVGATWSGVVGESNMPTRGSSWYEFMEVDRPAKLSVFKQPSGIAADAENTQYLKPDYYSNLMQGATKSWQQAHILCEYPDSLDGKAVFGATFDSSVHVAVGPLRPIKGSFAPPLIVGVDQGRSPAAVIAQVEPTGRVNIFKGVHGAGMGMEAFVKQILQPALLTEQFVGIPILMVIDPAGYRKTEVRDECPADILKARGFRVTPAPSNALERRISAVERLFMLRDGIRIDPECKTLIQALGSKYQYKTKKNGDAEDQPEKKHPWSDLCDALQYIALVSGGENYGRTMKRANRGATIQAAPPVRGWA